MPIADSPRPTRSDAAQVRTAPFENDAERSDPGKAVRRDSFRHFPQLIARRFFLTPYSGTLGPLKYRAASGRNHTPALA